MESAPFIVVGGSEKGKIEEREKNSLSLLCESSFSQQLFWNSKCITTGIISGSTALETTQMAKILIQESVMNDEDLDVVIFHMDNENTRYVPCSLVEDLSGVRALVAPKGEQLNRLKKIYGSDTQDLRVLEGDISLRHLLEIYGPTRDMNKAGDIRTAVQHIASQLNEPLEFDRFSQLVAEAKWDEYEERFMSLRSSILADLVIRCSGVSLRDHMERNRVILIDLTDPVLSSSNLNAVIMDIALRVFLDHESTRRKLMVFNAAEEYLHGESLIGKTVSSMLSGNKPSSVGILLTSHDPTGISISILTHIDFILSSPFPWLYGFCRNHWPSTGQAFRDVRRDQVVLISPGSIVMESSTGVVTKWGQVPLIIDSAVMTKDLKKSKIEIAPKGSLKRLGLPAKPFPFSTSKGIEVQQLGTQWMMNERINLDEVPPPQSQHGLLSASEESVYLTPDSQYTSLPDEERAEANSPPQLGPYEPLISILLELSGGVIEKDIDLRAVMNKLGGNVQIKDMKGHNALFQYLHSAQKQGVISLSISGDVMWIRLAALTQTATPKPQQAVVPTSDSQREVASLPLGELASDSKSGSSQQTIGVVGHNLTVSGELTEDIIIS
ncbi:hypothetical protein CPB86DRAFT_229237 [Serendipita vermifera]|nr:hypothetical protein CPB86DRAFT_229237 [Serendipita vermifera]